MRDIRARIAQRHGIELSTQQIQELAARRLEAILEPRNVKPQLLEQLRKSAGVAPELPSSPPLETYDFEETTLYETHRGILRLFRRLLHPILKLFFNPAPLVNALNTQARINKDLTARELERERRQSEWNALQYELVQRTVLEMSRLSLEMQALSSKIESLSAKVDFNERRVRGLETAPTTSTPRPQPRHQEITVRHSGSGAPPEPVIPTDSGAQETASQEGGEANRRRRRRRRGRRGGGAMNETTAAATPGASLEDDVDAMDATDGDEEETSGAPVTSTDAASAPAPAALMPPPAEPATGLAAGETSKSAAHVVPTPPPDEPRPADPVDHADPGPEDR
jgi:hypothetical protein